MQFARIITVMLVATTLVMAASVAATDEIYRWVDENGVVHFGDLPDKQGTAEEIELKQHLPSQNNRPEVQPLAEQEPLIEELSFAEKRRRERAEKKLQAAQRHQEIASQCAEAQQKVAHYGPRPRVMVENEDGTVSRIDDNKRLQILAAAKSYIDENCS